MARIFIDVHPDGTFTTGPYHGDPVAHAANQDEGVTTYMSEDVGRIEQFSTRLHQFAHRGDIWGAGDKWGGSWQLWGACAVQWWGSWFERVDGFKRRARLPTKAHRVDSRILGMLERSSPMLLSVLKNRMRGTPTIQVYESLARLTELGNVTEERFVHTINKTDTARYHLAPVKLADRAQAVTGCNL